MSNSIPNMDFFPELMNMLSKEKDGYKLERRINKLLNKYMVTEEDLGESEVRFINVIIESRKL